MIRRTAALSTATLAIVSVCPVASGKDLIFEYTSFEATFGQAQFDVLNYPSINGRYMNTSTDNHRPEMVANGNELAEFYNWLTDRYAEQTVKNGAAAADVINTYTVNNSTNNGPKPEWLVLNEISPSLWSANPGSPSISTYRTWLIDCVTRLTSVHGFKVVTLAPFQNPAQNNASWQALSAIPNNVIGIECYLSGPEVWAGGTDYDSRREWAEQQYAASKQSYMNRGVPEDKLFLIEHFANNDDFTDNGTPIKWGRANMASAAEWDQVIQIRNDAIYNVGFDGFLAYNWGGNGMGVTQAEQLQHEYYYRSRLVMPGQQPQWLSDTAINVNGTTIPLSWGQPLNWVGGVPNTAGAVANFYRTNTAARTVTLDGTKTVGVLTFHSPSSYTISPGTGGSIILSGAAGGPASVGVTQGSHTIAANVQLQSSATFSTDTGTTLTVSGAISGTGGLTKTGAGTLALTSSANNYGGTTAINAGVVTVTADTCLGVVPASFTANAITLNGGTWRNVGGTAITIPTNRGITVGPSGGTLDFSSTSGVPALDAKITGSGTLTKMGTKTLSVNSNSSTTFTGNLLIKQGRVNVNANGSSNALGTGTITLAAGNGDVAQLGIGGSGVISAALNNPISLSPTGNGQNSFEVNAGNTLTLSGVISGAGGLQKSGGSSSGTQGGAALVTTGTLVLTANNTYTGGTTVRDGTLVVKRLHENNAVAIVGGKVVVADSAPTLPAHPTGNNASVSRPSSLTISNNGAALGVRAYNATLDLSNNDLILDYTGTSPAASIEDMIRAGYHGGDWLGTGIASSTAAADNNYCLAIADNALLAEPFGTASGGPLFAGQNVDLTIVLVKFTHRADLNLDGLVTPEDASIFGGHYAQGTFAYRAVGDLDYDRLFTPEDAAIFGGFYNEGLASLPEPTALMLLSIPGLAMLSRRRRKV